MLRLQFLDANWVYAIQSHFEPWLDDGLTIADVPWPDHRSTIAVYV